MPYLPSYRTAWLGAFGALCAAAAVGLSAYAAHVALGHAQSRLQMAALFAFGHGVALAALTREAQRRLAHAGLLALALGVLLFCGSLVMDVLAQWPTTLAPLGGMSMIAGWVVLAIDRLRR